MERHPGYSHTSESLSFYLVARHCEDWESKGVDVVPLDSYFRIDVSPIDAVEVVRAIVNEVGASYARATVRVGGATTAVITRGPIMVCLGGWSHSHRSDKVLKGNLNVEVYAPPAALKEIVAKLDAKWGHLKTETPTFEWFYKGQGGKLESSTLTMEEPPAARDEYYPWLGAPGDEFFEDYFKSSAPILMLGGPPGTGKTSLLRSLVWKRHLHAMVAYDDTIFASDAIFVRFASDEDSDVLIIEDADTLLHSRTDGNQAMARLLNVSDGLILMRKKKIIFTTNISDFSQVDPALVRPGRCYATMMARDLSGPEAVVAARAAGIARELDPRRSYALADVFNEQVHATPKRRFGFAVAP